MILISITLWYVVGVIVFAYYWTKDYDLDTGDVVLCLYAATLGPMLIILFYLESLTLNKKRTTIIKRRNK